MRTTDDEELEEEEEDAEGDQDAEGEQHRTDGPTPSMVMGGQSPACLAAQKRSTRQYDVNEI